MSSTPTVPVGLGFYGPMGQTFRSLGLNKSLKLGIAVHDHGRLQFSPGFRRQGDDTVSKIVTSSVGTIEG